MTCKDCLYHERCHSEIAYGMGSDDLTGEYFTDIERRCAGFKNKADFVGVVRCKDCEHLRIINGKGLYAYCPKTECKFMPFEIDTRTHYCSCGKRKEGAEG